MSKIEFIQELKSKLKGLPKKDIEDRVSFYSEMIDDMVSEGKSENEAIEELGGIDKVVNDIASETSLVKLVKEKVKPKRPLKGWEIALIILGFPLWLPLLITGIALAFVFYILLWVLVITAYAVELSLIASIFAGIIGFAFNRESPMLYIGIALLSLGGAILFYNVCVLATKLTIKFTKKIFMKIKMKFIRRGE